MTMRLRLVDLASECMNDTGVFRYCARDGVGMLHERDAMDLPSTKNGGIC